jgi:hypothetical protein
LNLSVSPDLLADLDEWRHVQLDIPGRAEAARRLLEAALRATRRAKGKGEAPGAS